MIAALRQPTSSSVMAFPSAVMKRAVPGSDSMAVFAATSVPRQGRRISRSVAIPGPFSWPRAAPGLSGGDIGFPPLNWPGELLTAVIARSASDRSDLRRQVCLDDLRQLLL